MDNVHTFFHSRYIEIHDQSRPLTISSKKRFCNLVSAPGGRRQFSCSSFTPLSVLSTRELFHSDDILSDPRITIHASPIPHRSVLCIPIFSNRGQIVGAVYFADQHPFATSTVTVQTLLCKHAGISIANALLIHVVQSATKDNLRQIHTQQEALESARKSREEALQATKVI